MKGVILQPCFLPWRGYFDLVYKSDIFVFLDDVQYDKGSWRNRNKIRTQNGLSWLTVPVETKNKFHQKIKDTRISDTTDWTNKVLKSIYHSYVQAPYFKDYYPWLEGTLSKKWDYLSELDIELAKDSMKFLGLNRQLERSSDLGIESQDRNGRLIEICKKLSINHYLTGPSTQGYLDEALFRKQGITLEYMNYDYPPYTQIHSGFEPQVSVIDLFFNEGSRSSYFIWGCRDKETASVGHNSQLQR